MLRSRYVAFLEICDRASGVQQLVISLAFVLCVGFDLVKQLDLVRIHHVRKAIKRCGWIGVRHNWAAFAHPFFETAVQHSDVRVTHAVKHPCCSMAVELERAGLVADDGVRQFDVEADHAIDELLLVWYHGWQGRRLVFEREQVQVLGSFDMVFVVAQGWVVAFCSS